MTRADTLKQAEASVLVNRESTHGPPEDSFALIAKFWSAYLGIHITDYQVALMMGLLKIARLRLNPKTEDSWADLAGYSACGAELATSHPHDIVAQWDKGNHDPHVQKPFWDGIGSPAPLPASPKS